MVKTQISCPNCRQRIPAEIEQLYDMDTNPQAKQMLLSGQINIIQCPLCGFSGSAATPIVYHDSSKELLLTFVPGELGLPRDEQERQLGALINRVMNSLPQEKRKAYLLRPQAVLTLQGLIERILEGDGITREMIQAQQNKLRLLQRLLPASDEVVEEIVKQEGSLIDAEFFALMTNLGESALAAGDRESAVRISELQQKLLPITEYGRQLQEQSKEVEAAMNELRALGNGLTREKLLDLIIAAPTETRLGTYVSLTRSGLDYTFFELLSARINAAQGAEQERLKKIRETILEITKEIDQQTEARRLHAKQNLEALLQAPDIAQATANNLEAIDDYFVQILNTELEAARANGNLERSAKLNQILQVLQEAATPPEVQVISELLEIEDETALRQHLQQHPELITPDLLSMLESVVGRQVEESQPATGEEAKVFERIQRLYRMALRMSMDAMMKG